MLSFDFSQHGIVVSDEIAALACEILNSQTSEDPRRNIDEFADQVGGLTPSDQANLYLAVLVLYIRKLGMLASMADES